MIGVRIAGIVAAAIGLSQVAAGEPAEVAWAARRLFELLAAECPTVLVFEDVHWAEAAMLRVRFAPLRACTGRIDPGGVHGATRGA